jgi:hypothetical protein
MLTTHITLKNKGAAQTTMKSKPTREEVEAQARRFLDDHKDEIDKGRETQEYFAKLEKLDNVVDLKESRIGKELMDSRKEAINLMLAVYTDLVRIAEKVGNNLPQWCLAYTNVSLEEWYAQAVILPPDDLKRVRKRLKGPLDFFRRRDERDKRIAAARDISEVDEHIDPTVLREYSTDYDPTIPDPTPWEKEEEEAEVSADAPKTTAECEKLLVQLSKLESSHRVKTGKIYYKLRELVQTAKVGVDPETDKPWDWMKWCTIYIRQPAPTIRKNIQAYQRSLLLQK